MVLRGSCRANSAATLELNLANQGCHLDRREGSLSFLLYVSRSCISLDEADEVNEIVRGSLLRNSRLRLTGSLIFTGVHFAQLLEGPALSIRELMISICADKRHQDVTTVVENRVPTRSFDPWAMAYFGPSTYLDRHIKPLFDVTMTDEERNSSVDRIVQIMKQLHAHHTPR